jgi:hypothetical protein
MSKNYDAMIASEQDKLIAVKEQMETVKEKFILAMVEFLKKWYQKESREIITSNPEKSALLSNDDLKALKDETINLVEQVDEIVRERLNRETYWWHVKENTYSYPTYQHRIPEFLSNEIRILMGKLALIFTKKELIKIDSDHGDNRYNPDSSSFVTKGKEVRYRYALTNTGELEIIMQEYGKLHELAKNHLSQIERYKLEQKKENIGGIWDSL